MKFRAEGAFRSPGVGKISDRIMAYGNGRVCQAPSCGTHLSIYNPTPFCSLHKAGDMPLPSE